MTTNQKTKFFSKRSFLMIITSVILLIVLMVATPIIFFASIKSEWETRKDIKSVAINLDVTSSKLVLEDIAKNDRILDILAVSKDGSIIYALNNMTLFSDPNATVLYDSVTGLIKFDGGRTSYFQRNSILGSLLNVGDDDILDDDDDDDDDYRVPSFDYRFVKDNTYQVIELRDSGAGNTVYIICTQDVHMGFMLFFIIVLGLWTLLTIFFVCAQTLTIVDNAKKRGAEHVAWGVISVFTPITGLLAYLIYINVVPTCPECKCLTKSGNEHCTKCGCSLLPRTCKGCNTVAGKNDVICGKCGQKLD